MIQLALRIAELAIEPLKNLALAIKAGLTANANFPTPNPTPAQIQQAVDDVSAAQAELSAAESLVVQKRLALDQKVDVLGNVLRASATNCLDTVKNDPDDVQRTKMASANFPLRTGTVTPPDMTPLVNLQVSRGDHDCVVDGLCDRRVGAKLYRARCGNTPNGPWTICYEGTKSSFTTPVLPTGDTWFQMQAFVGGQWTEWCDPARLFVV